VERSAPGHDKKGNDKEGTVGTSVLIVDDEQVMAKAIADFLARHRYAVSLSTTGEEGLRMIDREPPDVVLLDYQLPRMGGLDVLRKIKEARPEIQVIMMTAYGSAEGAVEAIKLGAFDYISKPLDIEKLRLVVDKATELLRRGHDLNCPRSRADNGNPTHKFFGTSYPTQRA
jgi:DNA-binding NtrC family response regulator